MLDDKFVIFPCDCGEQLSLINPLMPGEAAVISCDNCQVSWTVFNPSLVIKKTKELPEGMQKVWEHLANG